MTKTGSKKDSESKKGSLGKYFISGIIVAVLLYLVLAYVNDSKNEDTEAIIWPAEAESLFVKSCYDKYRNQVKDDLSKQEFSKTFCRCMLEKIKAKYDAEHADMMSDEEAKQWGADCWSHVLNPNNLK